MTVKAGLVRRDVLERRVGAGPVLARFWSCSTAWRWKKVPRSAVLPDNAHRVALAAAALA
jgi:hypothetical protein